MGHLASYHSTYLQCWCSVVIVLVLLTIFIALLSKTGFQRASCTTGWFAEHSLQPLLSTSEASGEMSKLMSRCYRRLGDWKRSLTESPSFDDMVDILQYYRLATEHNHASYKGWHAWAFMNYEALNSLRQQPPSRCSELMVFMRWYCQEGIVRTHMSAGCTPTLVSGAAIMHNVKWYIKTLGYFCHTEYQY